MNIKIENKKPAYKKIALITGGAHRIGAHIVRTLHANHYRVIIHYRHAKDQALELCQTLNAQQADSAAIVQADFDDFAQTTECATKAYQVWQGLDVIINNASSFFPTTVGSTTLHEWQQLMNSNLLAPYFLVQAALPYLQANQGQVINIVDIHAERPLKDYAVYSIAKAGLLMLTKALACELGPDIRVNAIAPGITLWPENQTTTLAQQEELISRSVLNKISDVEDITRTVLFLLQQGSMTGEVIHVDCGRLLK